VQGGSEGRVSFLSLASRRECSQLDPRITSRVRFRSVNFPPYSDEELLTILNHRVIDCRALFSDMYSIKILRQIAGLAAGGRKNSYSNVKVCNFQR